MENASRETDAQTGKDGARPSAEATRQKLLAAGIALFSSRGYEATSTRQVEAAAGVQRNLITYHFGNKGEFWKACMENLFGRLAEITGPTISQSRDIAPGERIRFLIRQFVRVSAKYPEVTRIMLEEGRSDDWRLDWIVEHQSRRFYNIVNALFDEGGYSPEGLTPIQFYYALVSGAAIFAMAPECRRLSGQDPFSEEMIDAQANAIAGLLIRE